MAQQKKTPDQEKPAPDQEKRPAAQLVIYSDGIAAAFVDEPAAAADYAQAAGGVLVELPVIADHRVKTEGDPES